MSPMQSIICIHNLVLTQDKGRPFTHGWSFILSILFNIREFADIIGDLTDGMRDSFNRCYKLDDSLVAMKCSIAKISCFPSEAN